MSNRAYLAVCDADTIYPSFAQEDYEASNQLVATDVENVPLLWLALFREPDLRRTVFKIDGDEISGFAPVCSKENALAQLDQAIPYLEKTFPELGPLKDYGSMLRAAIEPLPYRFLSIELEEIANLYPNEHRFDELLTLGLRGFTNPDGICFHCEDAQIELQFSLELLNDENSDDEADKPIASGAGTDAQQVIIEGFTANSHGAVLEQLTGVRTNVRLPSVRMYLDNVSYSDDQQWNFTRVLGAGLYGSMGYGREVPWEKEDADFGFKIVTYGDDDEE